MKKKALIVVHHRKNRSPGQRYRIEQYLSFLEENDFEITFSYFINEMDDKVFYAPGHYADKFRILFKNFFLRLSEAFKINQYDVVYVYREAFVLGSSFFEKMVSRSKAALIFDFDDSIWIPAVSDGNKSLAFLKDPDKTIRIIKLANLVTIGNEYLAAFASQYNPNVFIIPTTIDLDSYKIQKTDFKKEGRVCIGWTGSHSTVQHFEYALPFLKEIKQKYGDKVYFKLIGDPHYSNAELGLQGVHWKAETEAFDLSELDIGIMPLPDDEWSKGKCGCKGLQYMALGIPSMMSPVGVNKDIVQHGVNGYLPSTHEDWIRDLSLLIENPTLRMEIGAKGYETVLQKYSIPAVRDRYVTAFNQVIENKKSKFN